VVDHFWAGLSPRTGRRIVVPFTIREPYRGSSGFAGFLLKVLSFIFEVLQYLPLGNIRP